MFTPLPRGPFCYRRRGPAAEPRELASRLAETMETLAAVVVFQFFVSATVRRVLIGELRV